MLAGQASDEALPTDAQALVEEMQILWTELETQAEELRLSQRAAEESRHHYFRLFDDSPVAKAVLDHSGCISEVNQAASALLNLGARGAVLQPVGQFVAYEAHGEWNQAWSRCQSEGSARLDDLPLRRMGGQQFVAQCSLHVWERGHTLLRITDVSDLRQTESQLREAAERYRSLFLANRDGILLVDPQTGAIVDANPAIGSLLGAHPAELLWQQLTSLFAPDRQLQQSLLLRRAREGGNPLIEIELRHGEGPLVSAEVTVSPTQIGNQLLEQYMVRDVSERRRLSEALVQAQKMEAVGQLAAGIAHDMNNVLTVVLAAGAALREEERPTDWMDALSELLEAAGRGRELVARLLSFSRRTPPRRRTFDLRLVVGEVARLLTRTLPASVRVRAEVPGEAVWLDGDESQWHQALLNLGVNGRDAMPAGGVFSLELRPAPGGRARLVARDTGTGMSEEVRRRAFEPFFTTKGQGAGTGLGLPIVFNVVTVHSGTIRIESGAEQGSAFHIEVPLAPPPAQAAAGASAAACLPMGRVLVVDDEPGVRSALTRLLERAGQRVVTAGSVDEGITRLGAEPAPTVVLCDVSMPERSGVELAEFLHRQPRPPPCVIMSGNLDPQVRTRLEGFGVQVFLEKPFSPQELTMALQRVMGGAAAR